MMGCLGFACGEGCRGWRLSGKGAEDGEKQLGPSLQLLQQATMACRLIKQSLYFGIYLNFSIIKSDFKVLCGEELAPQMLILLIS